MIKWLKRFLMASVAVAPVTLAATPPAPERDPLKIADMAVVDTAARPVRAMTAADYEAMKKRAAPADGVVPAADAKMAMDSYFPSANQFIAGVPFFDEDITFPGYPFLAALAQRAEYRMIVNAFSREMTRKWIEFTAQGKADKVKQLEDEFKRLRVREIMGDMIDMDGYFGRAQILPDFGDDGVNNALPLLRTKETVKKGSLKGFLLIEPIWSYPAAFNTSNPFKPDFYKPSGWWFVGKAVHVSRVFTMITHPVPDILKPMYAFGGLARTQLAKPYVDNWLRTRQSVSDTIHNYSVWAFKTNMSNVLAGGAVTEINKRAQIFNNMRDTRGVAVIDKEDEDFTNTSQTLTTLDDLQAQSQEHMASVAGVPLVVLLQITPKGLNTSTDGEMQAWHERIHAEQEAHVRPVLDPMMELIQLSLWGEIDPDITYRFLPLREPDAVQESTIRKTNADTAAVYITAGVLAPEDERERIAKEEGSLWHGMPLSEPEPPDDGDTSGGMAADEWNEGDHPRAPDGRFGEGAHIQSALEKAGAKVSVEHSKNWSERHGPSVSSYIKASLNGKNTEVRVSDHDNGMAHPNDSFVLGKNGALRNAFIDLGLPIPREVGEAIQKEQEFEKEKINSLKTKADAHARKVFISKGATPEEADKLLTGSKNERGRIIQGIKQRQGKVDFNAFYDPQAYDA